jgi:hypothetical protein
MLTWKVAVHGVATLASEWLFESKTLRSGDGGGFVTLWRGGFASPSSVVPRDCVLRPSGMPQRPLLRSRGLRYASGMRCAQRMRSQTLRYVST